MVKMMVVEGVVMRVLVKVMVYVFLMVMIKGEIKEGEMEVVGLGCQLVWVNGAKGQRRPNAIDDEFAFHSLKKPFPRFYTRSSLIYLKLVEEYLVSQFCIPD